MTKIQWTDETWNPVVGCSKVHTGCTHCYAEVMAARPLPAFVGRHNLTVTDGRWNGTIIEQPERLLLPLKWRKPRRVFVASMSDLGHPGLDDNTRAIIYGVMLLCPQHTFQNLTKRPTEIERFKREWSPTRCLDALMALMIGLVGRAEAWADILPAKVRWGSSSWEDVAHIHEYVSVSDQKTADEFIPQLLRVPAAMRGVSLEPMVGSVDFQVKALANILCRCLGCEIHAATNPDRWKAQRIDHVIIGGESGPNAREFALEWALSVLYQCRSAGVPVFIKQMGARPYVENVNAWDLVDMMQIGPIRGKTAAGCRIMLHDSKGGDPSEWPEDLRVRMHVGEGW